jgi:hypothetical protein
MAEPPEAALAGENVPLQNQVEGVTETQIELVMNALKCRGKPFITMNDDELRERAKAKIRKYSDSNRVSL